MKERREFKIEEMGFSSFPNTMEFVEWELAEPLDVEPLRKLPYLNNSDYVSRFLKCE
mgnify:CR=1 FL=1